MNTYLVLGGTGKTGRRVADRLRADGRTVRIASRTSGDVPFDLADPGTWAAALDGVAGVYVVEPDPYPGGDPATRGSVPGFVAAAGAAGVRRLVLLSAPGGSQAGTPLWDDEQAVRDSGADWTILRPTWFSQNFSEAFFLPGVLGGELALPTGDGRTPFVDALDIADVAVSALTGADRHAGQTYDLTGPRAIGFGEAADLIGRATGRDVRYADVTPEVFVEQQVAAGLPAHAAQLLAGLLTFVRDGSAAAVSDGVEKALGRPPRRFEDYVTEAAAAGAWS
ncbi:NAD(P)H-binding protein [Actinomadura decatromicini]|uniref:NAD(P)H-binding protein n=1 Tax=Actinomadura decatromicini TaxID=2604572 RepID=A0A5D3FR13_9ACTN|nr:NAD(P)H-binding protein [Actinomadura decatromicini]TYK50484.1 NAD(P)H-binding protein [Actinomadura decatromicini]